MTTYPNEPSQAAQLITDSQRAAWRALWQLLLNEGRASRRLQSRTIDNNSDLIEVKVGTSDAGRGANVRNG